MRSRRLLWGGIFVLAAGAAILVAYCVGHRPPVTIPVSATPDTLPDAAVASGRPNVRPPAGFGRVARHPVAVARSVSRGTPDTARVRAFARKVFEAESLRPVVADLRASGRVAEAESVSRGTPPALLPPVQLRYDGQTLGMWLSQSDGRVLVARARARARWEMTAGHGGTTDTLPLVVEDRWWLRQGREALGCVRPTVVLGLAGAALALLVDRDHVGRWVAGASAASAVGCMAD